MRAEYGTDRNARPGAGADESAARQIRYRLLLKTAKNVNIQEVLKKWLNMVKIKSNVRVDVDINPYSFM